MNLKDGNKSKRYLVETALLGHGLISIRDDEILELWPDGASLAWVEKGEIRIGTIQEFIPSRSKSDDWKRLDGLMIKQGLSNNINAFLTASATMVVAKEVGYPLVVSAGIGGIGNIKSEKFCYDLTALANLGISLVATSPKDMLDIEGTFDWLKNKGVRILGFDRDYCNGYLMILNNIKLAGELNINNINNFKLGYNLILNHIPENKRIKDLSFLTKAIKVGENAEEDGKNYHPAVNAAFDQLSLGNSSKIQLESLISNIRVAELIVKNKQIN